jgi:hypothetical protein
MHTGLDPVSSFMLNRNAVDVLIMLVDTSKSDVGICS